MATDFTVSNHGSIYLLTPKTEAAHAWRADHLPDDVLSLGQGLCIEHRYIGDIVLGINADGLTIGDA